LRGSGAVWRVDDTLDAQRRDLVRTRSRAVALSPAELEARAAGVAGERWILWRRSSRPATAAHGRRSSSA
jgi:hypothetical protein